MMENEAGVNGALARRETTRTSREAQKVRRAPDDGLTICDYAGSKVPVYCREHGWAMN